MVRGPEQKGQRVGGSCGFLGQHSSSKEINFHESKLLSLPHTAAEQICVMVMTVYNSEDRLSLSLCPDGLFLFYFQS